MREFDGTDLTGSFEWLMPPSKSHMIRWLALGSQSYGETNISFEGVPGEDSFSMANCLATMGSKIDFREGNWLIEGPGDGLYVPHNVLNAKNHENEAEIIALAGKPFQVTVATNMAGRGTDIKLGGNPDIDTNYNESDYQKVIDLGGLCILGTERHESRRIDNQLRGRSGRQGDPGESIFFVSLEDDLMRIFGSEKLQSMLSTLGLKQGEVIEHKWLTSSIERAQKRVEGHNFDIRKQLLEFDNIIDKQRNIIYSKRETIIKEDIISFIQETEDEFITNLLESENEEIKNFSDILSFIDEQKNDDKEHYLSSFKKIKDENYAKHTNAYIYILRQVSLSILDKNWHNHIQELTNIRMSVSLSGYGGKDPVNEFRKASLGAFNQLIYELSLIHI